MAARPTALASSPVRITKRSGLFSRMPFTVSTLAPMPPASSLAAISFAVRHGFSASSRAISRHQVALLLLDHLEALAVRPRQLQLALVPLA